MQHVPRQIFVSPLIWIDAKIVVCFLEFLTSSAMASASSTSAKNLFADSKQRLAERVQVNVNNIGSITRQVRGF